MWTSQQLKERGRNAFKRNYWPSVGAGLLLMILTAGSAAVTGRQTGSAEFTSTFNNLTPNEQAIVATAIMGTLSVIFIVSILLRIFVFNPLQVGCYQFFKRNLDDPNTPFGTVTEGFGDYGRTFLTLFLRDLFIALWSILLIVPGIMKAYSYRMVPFIIKDRPELSTMEVLAESSRMMQGNRWNTFMLDLSFIGWFLLGAVTMNLGNIFWAQPYHASTNAALYQELCRQ